MNDLISKKIRGFRDILPAESKKFLHIENIIHRIAPIFNVHLEMLYLLYHINVDIYLHTKVCLD